MAQVKNVTSQTNFSAGQVDPSLKRNERHPAYQAGARQCINYRILNTQALANRHGRSAKFLDGPRIEEVLLAPGIAYMLCFSTGQLQVRTTTNYAVVPSSTFTAMPWTASTVNQIVWAIYQKEIFITFPGMQPIVLGWDPDRTPLFTLTPYNETVNRGGQKRTFFYRLSPLGVTMHPSGSVDGTTITVTFSAPVTLSSGTRLRYNGRQVLITGPAGVNTGTSFTAFVEERLPQAQSLHFVQDPAQFFSIDDVVLGSQSGAKGLVEFIDSGSMNIIVTILNGTYFQENAGTAISNEYAVGPSGSFPVNAVARIPPVATTVWDDEVMNAYRGWPASCFVDQNRLGFCNFPDIPAAVGWSGIGLVRDLYVPDRGITAANAIFELAPGKSQVLYVLPGAESDEFVFCDNATYAIPITEQQPLAPGSVAFNRIDEGIASVQPRFYKGAIIYVNSGGHFVRAITATGSLTRPYESRDLTDWHTQLFGSIVAISAPDGDTVGFGERYIYVLNSDGTVVACTVEIENGQVKDKVPGWTRYVAGVGGTINWVSARLGNAWFNVSYAGATGPMAELLDATQYLDAAILVNSPPPQLVPPSGKGPLWWAPGQPVTLLDQGLRQMGVYQTDANGFIIPQFIGGENLTSPQLVAGHAWTATLEPFVRPMPIGDGAAQDLQQHMLRRQITQAAVYFGLGTGYLWQKLFAGDLTPTSPAYGTVMKEFRVVTYNVGDDATQPAPLRESTELWRPGGSEYDPRITIVKDTAGPLIIMEFATEVSV